MKKFKINLLALILAFFTLFSFSACTEEKKESYTINTSYFSSVTFSPYSYSSVNVQTGAKEVVYALKFTTSCSVSLYEYSATVNIFSSSNTLLDCQTIKRTGSIDKHESFSFDIDVTEEIQLTVDYVDVIFTGKSYEKPSTTNQKHSVTFIYNNGNASSTTLIDDGKTVSIPSTPYKPNYTFVAWYTDNTFIKEYDFSKPVTKDLTLYAKYKANSTSTPSLSHQVTFIYNNGAGKYTISVENGLTISTPVDPSKNNHIFFGWYTESNFANRYDFSKPVTKDLTLYAKFVLDTVGLTNKISTDTIKGVVTVYNKSYNSFLGIETSSTTSQGSGVCFKIQNGYYYILTNCHVALKDADFDDQQITIKDYQGNTYEGHIYKNPNKTYSAIAASYDLACIYFTSSTSNVKSLPLLSTNPTVETDVIALGAPNGQANCITFGSIVDYKKITLSNTPTSESNVTFNILRHTASIDNGSSGGPILNSNLKVIGINYAGSGSGVYGYSIPAEKVREFLEIYVYN